MDDYLAQLKDGIQGLKVGVPRRYFFESGPEVEPETLAAIETALGIMSELGAEVQDVEILHSEQSRYANQAIMMSEAFAFHEHNLKTRRQDFGDMVRDRFLLGGLLTTADYVQAQRVRRLIKDEMAAALREVDVLVTPTSPKPAAAFAGYTGSATLTGPSFTGPFNASGLPAISIPGGFSSDGLPIGLQIAGRPFAEATVFRAAYAYEQAARWFDRRPPV